MKMIPDRTGRFALRPYWEVAELEGKCEEAITSFLRQRYGFDRIPVPTEAITALIERDAGDLDLRPNLSDDDYEVFGYTIFQRGRAPRVVVARELWEQRHRSNRLRMTLGHEYGHLLLHAWLYKKYGCDRAPDLCYWQSLLPSERVLDWQEWQAGYAGGALLMPETFTRRTVAAFLKARREVPPIARDCAEARALRERISLTFDVSVEAASVRLSQLGIFSG